MPTTLTDYLEVVCGVDTSAFPESGAIQMTLSNRCDLDAADVIITPDDQVGAATITLKSSYVDRKSQASAMSKYRRISGQEAEISLSLQNPFDEKYAPLFLQGQAIAGVTPAPTPDEATPWAGKKRTEFRSNAGRLPKPYLVKIQFAIGGSGEFAPVVLYAPMAFPTFDQIALTRSVDAQSDATVKLECKADPDNAGLYLTSVYE